MLKRSNCAAGARGALSQLMPAVAGPIDGDSSSLCCHAFTLKMRNKGVTNDDQSRTSVRSRGPASVVADQQRRGDTLG